MKRPFLALGFGAFFITFLREFFFSSPEFDLPFIIALSLFFIAFTVSAVFIKSRRPFFVLLSFFFASTILFSSLWSVKNVSRLKIQNEFNEKTELVTVKICEEPALTKNGYYRYVGFSEDIGAKIVFYGNTEENIDYGSLVKDTFTLTAENSNYYRYNGISFYAKRVKYANSEISPPEKTFDTEIHRIKNKIELKFDYLFSGVSDFIKGLTFGDTSSLSPDTKEDFRTVGISHLLAVSGLHVGIISLFVFFLFSKSKNKYLKYIAASVFIFLLALFSGFSPSVMRAAIMQAVVFLSSVFDRKRDVKNAFGLALFLLLLLDPLCVSSPSFLLSFAATGGIIFLFPPVCFAINTFLFKYFSSRPNKITLKIRDVFYMSLICSAVTSPITFFCFGEFSLWGIIGNIFIFPFVTVTFISALVATVIGFIPILSPLSVPFAYITKLGGYIIMYLANFLAKSVKTSSEFTLDPSFVADNFAILSVISLLLLGIIIYVLVSKKRGKKALNKKAFTSLVCVFAVIVLSLCVFIFSKKSEEKVLFDGKTEITFVDVGQGNAVVLDFGEKVYVYDCGGTTMPGKKTAEYILKSGHNEIEAVVISHLHSDHMNGIYDLVSSVNTKEVIIPYTSPDKKEEEKLEKYLKKQGTTLTRLYDDTKIPVTENLSFSLLLKHMSEDNDENDNSTVLYLDYGKTDLLLCGDLSKVGEKKLIECYPDLDTDIFECGHHGSKYSACDEFLKQITPDVSFISVGKDNSYGHPDKKTVSRLKKYGEVYTTVDFGNVTVIADGKTYFVKTEK